MTRSKTRSEICLVKSSRKISWNFSDLVHIRISKVLGTVHQRLALTTVLVVFALLYNPLFGQVLPSTCPVSATANANGTVTLNAPNLTILNECHDALNTSFIASLYHVKCTGVADEYVIMTSDEGKVYHFQLPYQNPSYYGQWCGQTNLADWYQGQVKYVSYWQHPSYNIQCTTVLSNGDQCSRFSELSNCWQHR